MYVQVVLIIKILTLKGLTMQGMMWFDNSKGSLEEKIENGLKYFEKKYGEGLLDRVFVKPGVLNEKEEVNIGGLIIRSSRSVLNNHFYFVVKDE
jgi:hypothetical protein